MSALATTAANRTRNFGPGRYDDREFTRIAGFGALYPAAKWRLCWRQAAESGKALLCTALRIERH